MTLDSVATWRINANTSVEHDHYFMQIAKSVTDLSCHVPISPFVRRTEQTEGRTDVILVANMGAYTRSATWEPHNALKMVN